MRLISCLNGLDNKNLIEKYEFTINLTGIQLNAKIQRRSS